MPTSNLRGCALWLPPLGTCTCCPSGPHTLQCSLVKVSHHGSPQETELGCVPIPNLVSPNFFVDYVLFPTCDLALLGTLNRMDFTSLSFDLSHLLCCSFPFISVRHLIERPEVAMSESRPIGLYEPNNVSMPQGRNDLICRFLSFPFPG